MLAIWIGRVYWRCQIHTIKKVLAYSKRHMETLYAMLENDTKELEGVAKIAT
jgi:hypothetical protein